MAELTKFGATKVVYHIKHDLRELPHGKTYGNEAVEPSLSKGNYSILEGRCQTATEANKYRKQIEKEIFKYNRKNLVHAVEIYVQCPSDCPAEQKDAFFRETYSYICSTLPMGERCVFVAQIHVDERQYSPTGEMISKDHLHVMYIPAVKDSKHDGYEYRLCADQLTKKARLKEFHPGLQKHLDEAGIHATVFRKKNGDGKAIGLSVSQLKELTKKTGITLDHSLTVDELAEIINSNILHEKQARVFRTELAKKQCVIEDLSAELSAKESSLKDITLEKSAISYAKDKEIAELRQALRDRDVTAVSADRQNEQLRQRIAEMEKNLTQTKTHEKSLEIKVEKLEEQEKTATVAPGHAWGLDAGWESHTSGWGSNARTHNITSEEEKTW